MTFATINENMQQLDMLSRLLLTVFPGSTIHQSCDPARTARCLSTREVDAVFADADACSGMLDILCRQNRNTRVYLLCRQELPSRDSAKGVSGVMTYPITEQKLRAVLHSILKGSEGEPAI